MPIVSKLAATLLQVAGLGLLVAAAFAVSTALGYAVLGAAALLVGIGLEKPR